MNLDELDNKDYLKKIKEERGFYGDIKDKPETEQQLFKLQDLYFNRRNSYNKAVEQWKLDKGTIKPDRKDYNTNRDYSLAYTNWLKKINEPIPVDTSGEVWSQMLEIVYSYTKSMVLKRNTGKTFMEPEEVSNKAIESALAFMNQYLKRDDFVCAASFSGLIKWKIVESLYKGHDDYHISLNQIISDETSSDTVMEHISSNGEEDFLNNGENICDVENEVLKDKPIDVINGIMEELDSVIGNDSRLAFLCRLYLIIILRVPKTRHIKRLFMECWGEDYKTEQVLESVQLELFNRMTTMNKD